ncbi:MAG: ATP-dependent DNA helicase [Lachnospiraceae bacterium]|nr:ATP-dependent DNA helicase [Lachnospiraceae bacterium]
MEGIQKIRISVRNLVEFILREGDIDNRRGSFGEKEAMQEGSRLHRKIQREMGSGYRAEVPLSIDVLWKEPDANEFQASAEQTAGLVLTQEAQSLPAAGALVLTVEGRADGIFADAPAKSRKKQPTSSIGDAKAEIQYIDEIKGTYRDVLMMEEPIPVHLAQAKCYAYIYGSQQALPVIGVQMTYCTLETEQVRRFRQIFTIGELEAWFMDVTGRYRKWANLQLDWQKIRQESIRQLAFPFPWRPGQREVAASVYRTIARGKKLFIQAPTGTGKTLSTVFPAVKAIGEGLAERMFYATAKTITRTVAEEAFATLREHGLHMRTVTLTAKEKICFLEEPECNPEACPYAKGHYDRINDAVFALISEKEALDRPLIESQARKWRVCPFEMGLDAALWVDGVICDYNYIFDPRARLKRFFGEGVKGEYLFLIDEAHNLVERSREMYSASLYKEDFLALKKEFQSFTSVSSQSEGHRIGSRRHRPAELMRTARAAAKALNRCNTWLLEQKRGMGEDTRVTLINVDTFPVILMNLCGLLEEFLDDSLNAELNEKALELYFQVRRFLDTCDRLTDRYVTYAEQCADGRFMLRLYCVDASDNLQACLDKGKSTVWFSATFLPIQYYKRLLSAEKDNYAIYANSVFNPSNRLVLIGTDTSSRYVSRTPEEYRKMAAYILQIMRARRGNYMVFFSSYRMMDDVADQFDAICVEEGEAVESVRQMNRMSEKEREEFLAKFEQPHPQGLVGFCVMGGIFGEGIDLREDRLIGAVIVGTGLPQVCTERELLKNYYDKRGEDGFFYAYLCPGMNRVLQSAGRVIRTEKDKGVILLLDERFAAARYRRLFPAEWEHPVLCSLRDVHEKAEAFWRKE